MTRSSRRYPCRDCSRSHSRHRSHRRSHQQSRSHSRDHSGQRSHYRIRDRSHGHRRRRSDRYCSPSNDYSSGSSRSRSRSRRRSHRSSRDQSRSRFRTHSRQRHSGQHTHRHGSRHRQTQPPIPTASALGLPPAVATSSADRLLELLSRIIDPLQPPHAPQLTPCQTPGFDTPGGVFSKPPRWTQSSQVDHYQSSAGTSDALGSHARSYHSSTTQPHSHHSNVARTHRRRYDDHSTESESEEEAPRRSRAATSRRRSSPSPPRYRDPSPSPSQRRPVWSPEQPAFSSQAHSPKFLASTSHTRAFLPDSLHRVHRRVSWARKPYQKGS